MGYYIKLTTTRDCLLVNGRWWCSNAYSPAQVGETSAGGSGGETSGRQASVGGGAGEGGGERVVLRRCEACWWAEVVR